MSTSERMSFFGVGPLFVKISIALNIPPIILTVGDPAFFRIPYVPTSVLIVLGGVLIAIGLTFALIAASTLQRGFPTGQLLTKGVYGMCRHPVYGVWVVFIVPGLMLIVNTWLGLLVPLLMYIVLRILVRSEEQYLEATFGEEYRAYRRRTPAVFPIFWRRPAGE